MKIANITIEITNRCNMRCAMCGIWEETQKNDLTIKAIASVFEHRHIEYPIGSLSLTGGEVFLHPKLDTIYRFIYLMKKKKKVDTIDIVTSGYLTKRILRFLETNKEYLAGLEIDFSIDGLQENHVKQRGLADAYTRTWSTINNILKNYPTIRIAVKYTINAQNVEDILPVYKLCKEKKIAFLPKFIENHTVNYYHRVRKKHSLFEWTPETLQKSLDILTHINQEINDPMLARLIAIGGKKENVKTCRTPELSLFITADGNIYPCIYMEPIGNIYSAWGDLLGADKHKQDMTKGKTGSCPKCISYHGYLRSYNL